MWYPFKGTDTRKTDNSIGKMIKRSGHLKHESTLQPGLDAYS